jgi:two-component system, LytTR family, response regulator
MGHMNELRTAIVHNEPLTRLHLRRLLSAHSNILMVGEYHGAAAVLRTLPKGSTDVLLLDINANDEDSFALLAALPPPLPYTIFAAAHADHAARVFGLDADTDYLIKPISAESLAVALVRAQHALARRKHFDPSSYLARMMLPIGRKMCPVEAVQIESVVADGNYVEIKVGERIFLLRRALTWFAEQLDPAVFARIHRSTIVRIDAVQSLEPLASGRHRIKLHSGAQHVSGRSYRNAVRAAFKACSETKSYENATEMPRQ